MVKIIRSSTVPLSLNVLLKGQLRFLSNKFEVIGLSSFGDDLTETRVREGIEVIGVNMKRGISPINDIVSLVKLYLIFRKEKPTIVHSITPKAGLLCMLASNFAKVPIRMHTFTGLIFPSKTGIFQKILIFFDKVLCWSSTNIYAEGKGVLNDLTKYKITAKPIKIIGNGNVNGIDSKYFSNDAVDFDSKELLKKDLNIVSDDFVFVFVGRIVSDKGINELIKAFSMFEDLKLKLILVGAPEEHLDPLKKETNELIKNNKRILTVGFQKDVRPYLAISNVLVFPSYREGFPNVVLQAGAMELPSIVTDINGSNEIVFDGKNGLIVPPRNFIKLYEAMKEIYNNIDLYNNLKNNSRNAIVDKFNQQFVWTSLLNEYNKLIDQGKFYV